MSEPQLPPGARRRLAIIQRVNEVTGKVAMTSASTLSEVPKFFLRYLARPSQSRNRQAERRRSRSRVTQSASEALRAPPIAWRG